MEFEVTLDLGQYLTVIVALEVAKERLNEALTTPGQSKRAMAYMSNEVKNIQKVLEKLKEA